MHRLPDGNIPAYMEADTIEGDPDSDLTLTGAAQVRRIDGVIKGDRINYRKDTGEVDVQGNARMMRDGTLVTGPNAKFNVDKYSGEVESRISGSAPPAASPWPTKPTSSASRRCGCTR